MRTVTAHTLSRFTGTTATGMTFRDVTVLLVRMTAAQVQGWKWLGDERIGEDPVQGWEVRDTTGALLGVVLPLGHRATRLHAEFYDPEAGDFFPAGETNAAVTTQGLALVLDGYTRHVDTVPAGEGFDLDEPRYVPPCWVGACPEDCELCACGWWERQGARPRRLQRARG
ncbi:hypothetical protein [Streptomyces sp. NBC_01233]|uniref:hypothetical protein n=1 Tax=Streptomyces sp. NBC_01233 TaxID=2903787 RepID=UPI002E10F7D9|nr:hypothetical protein OG332_24115 [Streptomyces sp. NBC_01233]